MLFSLLNIPKVDLRLAKNLFFTSLIFLSACSSQSAKFQHSQVAEVQNTTVPIRLISLGDTREAPLFSMFRKVSAQFAREANIHLQLESLQTLPYPSPVGNDPEQRIADIRNYIQKFPSAGASPASATVVFLPKFEGLRYRNTELAGFAEGVGAYRQRHSPIALILRSGSDDQDALVFAHEVGHLLGATHESGGIMARAVDRRGNQFTPRAVFAMQKSLQRQLPQHLAQLPETERALFRR